LRPSVLCHESDISQSRVGLFCHPSQGSIAKSMPTSLLISFKEVKNLVNFLKNKIFHFKGIILYYFKMMGFPEFYSFDKPYIPQLGTSVLGKKTESRYF
jgi:hypothetical protein